MSKDLYSRNLDSLKMLDIEELDFTNSLDSSNFHAESLNKFKNDVFKLSEQINSIFPKFSAGSSDFESTYADFRGTQSTFKLLEVQSASFNETEKSVEKLSFDELNMIAARMQQLNVMFSESEKVLNIIRDKIVQAVSNVSITDNDVVFSLQELSSKHAICEEADKLFSSDKVFRDSKTLEKLKSGYKLINDAMRVYSPTFAGKGKQKTSTGRYIGEIKNGKPNGKGRMIYAYGAIYEGDFKDGLREGEGRQIEKGTEYYGSWKADKPDENGKLSRYLKAQSLMENKEYYEARNIFEELGKYRDSVQLAKQCSEECERITAEKELLKKQTLQKATIISIVGLVSFVLGIILSITADYWFYAAGLSIFLTGTKLLLDVFAPYKKQAFQNTISIVSVVLGFVILVSAVDVSFFSVCGFITVIAVAIKPCVVMNVEYTETFHYEANTITATLLFTFGATMMRLLYSSSMWNLLWVLLLFGIAFGVLEAYIAYRYEVDFNEEGSVFVVLHLFGIYLYAISYAGTQRFSFGIFWFMLLLLAIVIVGFGIGFAIASSFKWVDLD